jgi:hypothetical protein
MRSNYFSFRCFIFGFAVESIKEFGGVSHHVVISSKYLDILFGEKNGKKNYRRNQNRQNKRKGRQRAKRVIELGSIVE